MCNSYSNLYYNVSEYTTCSIYGQTNIELLSGNDSLPSQQSGQITLVVRVRVATTPSGRGPFDNTALGSGTAGNVSVNDSSIPGLNPDPLNTGDSKSFDTPTRTTLGSVLGLPSITK